MRIEQEPDLELEIAHVLLIDVVDYSKLLVNEQFAVMQTLNRAVRETAHFRSAEASGKLTRLPTGDGMALLFFDSPETPAKCALEVSKAMKEHPAIHLRMGAHSGPIKEVTDVNDKPNFAGAGINMAQRVLDCGDAGHILISQRMAEDLAAYRRWHPCLRDLGECEVKHGVRLHLFNLCKDDLGNPLVPAKIKCQRGLVPKWTAATRRWVGNSVARRVCLKSSYALFALALAASLWWLTRPSSEGFDSIPEKSIAVLPFDNRSNQQENAYIAYGVQDEIRTDLSRLADLKVISQTSVMQYQEGHQRNVREIARALGVAYVLEGSVQASNGRIRVHAQLIDARKDTQLWAHSYERALSDVFAIQSEVAQEIAGQLKAHLSPSEKEAIELTPTTNMNAHDYYTRAKSLLDGSVLSTRAREDLYNAIKLLNDAIAEDPKFFHAYYQLAHAYDQLYLRFERTPKCLREAEAALKVLQRLRPDSGETHLALAKHSYWGLGDHERARKELDLAARSLPNDPLIALLTGYIDRREGKWDAAETNLRRAHTLDPRNPLILQQIALSYFNLRQYEKAIAAEEEASAVAPDDPTLQVRRAGIELEWRGETKPLHEVLANLRRDNPAAAASVADTRLYLALCERDAVSAQAALSDLNEEGCNTEDLPLPRSWCEGVAAGVFQNEAKARPYFARALAEAEKRVQEQPGSAGSLCVLGLTHAALGQKEEAMEEGIRATQLLPVSKDALDGALMAEYLAVIFSISREKNRALEQLATVVSRPGYLSYGNLKLHPYWDPLRGDPRFEQIVASLAPR